MPKTSENLSKQLPKGLFRDVQEYQGLKKKTNKSDEDLKKIDELYKKLKNQMMMFYVLFIDDQAFSR